MLKTLVEEKLGHCITNAQYREAKNYADIKLENIISYFGTAGGERLKPYYLVALIAETVQFKDLQRYFDADDIPAVVAARDAWD